MKSLELEVARRQVFRKKVKSLRRAGIIPINVYGHGIDSMSLQAEARALDKLLSQAGMTHLVSLKIEGAKSPRNVIIKEVQRKGGTGKALHVSFYQVRMEEKIKVEVPIHFIGESPAVKSREGDLMTNIRALEVECLPGNIPEGFTVDVSNLLHPGDAVHVKDLEIGEEITLLTDPEQMVIKVETIKVEVEEVVKVPEAVAEGVAPEAAEVKEEEKKPGEAEES